MSIFEFFQATNKKQELSFYSIPEFNEWKDMQPNIKSWKIKYYKGLCPVVVKLNM